MLIKCKFCQKEFNRKPSRIKENGNNFCSEECDKKSRRKGKETKCDWCKKDIYVEKHRSNMKHNFCDRNCQTIFFKKHPSNKGNGKKLSNRCKECDTLIFACHIFCQKCRPKQTRIDLSLPIKMFFLGEGSNKYARIRIHGRHYNKQRSQYCINCDWKHHVECCHIKPISKFDPETPIGIVNGPNNIMSLCPNCHWLFDKGLINPGRKNRTSN